MSSSPETLSFLQHSIDRSPRRDQVTAALLVAIFIALCLNVGSAMLGLLMLALAAVGSGLPVTSLPV